MVSFSEQETGWWDKTFVPVTCKMRACVGASDLFLGPEGADFVARLGEQRSGELDKGRRQVGVLSWEEREKSLLYRATHICRG